MTVNTGDNRYGPPIYLVDPTAGNGTHTTISAAVTAANTAAVSNVTIFVRPGTYSGNFTPTVAMTITAWTGDGIEGNVIITGTVTVSSAITVTLSNVQLQTNSANSLVVSGSAASIVNIKSCYLNCTNNTGISFTTSSASAQINIFNCSGNLGTTGIAIVTSTSAGNIVLIIAILETTGASTTANTTSTGAITANFSNFGNPFSCTSTGEILFNWVEVQLDSINTTAITTAGTGLSGANFSILNSGTASAISIGSGTTFSILGKCNVGSTNTNAITGAGTLNYGILNFNESSNTVNTTTQNPKLL